MIMTPKEIVSELDKHIVGQQKAKKAVAIALRNRWRRQQVPEPLRSEIHPKNILMIGPTGVGKTEIARRLAKLANAPFIKVEATKFTEVGYVGRDVDTIIRDLVKMAIQQVREQAADEVRIQAEEAVEERLLDALLPPADPEVGHDGQQHNTRETLRKRLREGRFEETQIDFEVPQRTPSFELIGAGGGIEDIQEQLKHVFSSMSRGKRERKITVAEARKFLMAEETMARLDKEKIKEQAIARVEASGIVFLDEIDKIATRGDSQAEVSRQGVQRDLLPLVEGTTVNTKYGMVKTDHILFIASGAFHLSRPSDLVPELQGRFPIRVELDSLSVDDFIRILDQTDAALTKQYTALLGTEDVKLDFCEDGIARLAELAFEVNERTENIGARRLYTVMEKLLESVSYDAQSGQTVVIDADYVNEQLKNTVDNQDLSRYVL